MVITGAFLNGKYIISFLPGHTTTCSLSRNKCAYTFFRTTRSLCTVKYLLFARYSSLSGLKYIFIYQLIYRICHNLVYYMFYKNSHGISVWLQCANSVVLVYFNSRTVNYCFYSVLANIVLVTNRLHVDNKTNR